MKIAIASDFHLGFNDDALMQAREALKKACELADVIVAPGDLFDARVPRQEVILDALKLFDELRQENSSKAKVRIVGENGGERSASSCIIGIHGTHERRSRGMANPVHLLDSVDLLVDAHSRKVFVELDGEKVVVQGMGGVPEEFAKRAIKLLDFKPVEGAFNVFLFHQNFKELIPVAEHAVSSEDLPSGFDLYVNGHIHWAEDLSIGGKRVIIPGSTVVTQMKKSEARQKGFFLFDTQTKQAQFIAIPARPFIFEEMEFNEASPAEVEKRVQEKLGQIASKSFQQIPLVKIKLSGTLAKGLTQAIVDLRAIEERFKDSMILSIDKEFLATKLEERIDFVRRMVKERKGLREICLELLRKKLVEKKYSLGDEEELLDLLSEGEVEQALKKVLS